MKKHLCFITLILLFLPLTSLARKKVGLVFGGGGAKGAAEIGVLKTIEKAGIPIDYIVGTSIGSIVGGLYACGVSSEHMEQLFRSQEWINLFAGRNMKHRFKLFTTEREKQYVMGFELKLPQLVEKAHEIFKTKDKKRKRENALDTFFSIYEQLSHPLKNLGGILSGDSITALLARETGQSKDIDFDKLPIPFRCVAADVHSMTEVIHSKGSLPLAIRSSMSFPFVFEPVEMDGKLLVDGGMVNNLPVDIARKMGADIVIAIDLSQTGATTRKSGWVQLLQDLKLGDMAGWLIERPDDQRYLNNLKEADLVIRPTLHEFDVTSFSATSINTMIQRGEEAGREAAIGYARILSDIYGF
ncbi:MAG: patatin-like phospholipase family protein [Bacteroidales bacterium]|nr:patatin-like phospholipase family protein [Candidatus Physcousia equi]